MISKTKILTMTFAIAAILVASPIAMQSASAGNGMSSMMDCSTDKFNPTIGDLSSYVIVIANAGDNCYLGQYGETTEVFGVYLEDAGKVNVVNTEIGYSGTEIDGTTDYVKFKDNELHTHAYIEDNDVTHLEVMDNYVFTGYTSPVIFIEDNTAIILKVVGNSVDTEMDENTVGFFAFCRNNADLSGGHNTYVNKNKGCPEDR